MGHISEPLIVICVRGDFPPSALWGGGGPATILRNTAGPQGLLVGQEGSRGSLLRLSDNEIITARISEGLKPGRTALHIRLRPTAVTNVA
jgi:hypothetical protein